MPRLTAFHLPQLHPVAENDEWWGKGFTEWTGTAKTAPLFRGHHQHVPADLGFNDLEPDLKYGHAYLDVLASIAGADA